MPLDRLTAADLLMLRPEDVGWRQDIGALVILDGVGLVDRSGALRLADLRARIDERLARTPRLRQVLVEPGWGRGGPLWVDAPRFDVADHVGVVPLPPGAGEGDLLDQVELLRRPPFDPARPRWEMWFLPGLPGGRVALYVKVHHAIADGVAGILFLGAFLDLEPDVPPAPVAAWVPRPAPTDRELVVDILAGTGRALATWVAGVVGHPVRTARVARQQWGSFREAFERTPAPLTSANRRIGPTRRLQVVRADLDDLRAVGHAHGATVNDVLVTAVTGGYRRLLAGRGEPIASLTLRASVPVSLHGDDPAGEEANRDGMMFVPLPVGLEDPVECLAAVARETRWRKQRVFRPPGGRVAASRPAQRLLWRRFDRQRWSNGYVANVPGPPVPLYFDGSRVEEVFPIVPIMGNLTIGVGAMSYAGRFAITVVADVATCPDVEVFTDGLRATLAELTDRSPDPASE